MEYLATPPEKGEQSGNFSSYDRKSAYDAGTMSYTNWTANSDGSGYIRKEGKDIVIFEMDGPGVIWRFWSALAKEGHIKIFIDHAEKPVVDKPFRELFETFGSDIPPMNFPNLVMTLSRGRNSFLPIPFNKHCKILLSENWGAYYHITYTRLPAGTKVASYTGRMSVLDCIALAEADRFLEKRGYGIGKEPGEQSEDIKLKIKPGSRVLVRELKGNMAITGLRLKADGLEKDNTDSTMLRDLWLRITWDSDKIPSVLSPIGMFFGTGNSLNPYRSLPTGVVGDEMYSNWYMPFGEKAIIELLNLGDKRFEASCRIVYLPVEKANTDMLRFHALWHDGSLYKNGRTGSKSELIPVNHQESKTISGTGRDIDWPILKISGRGRFCGVTLHVENVWKEPEKKAETWWYGKWNNKTIDWWWGEGDEKFFVDGEKFPSTFGTGSEDYIGYAWSAEPPFPTFNSPFACQPHTPLNGNGHTIVNRFHIADNVPFQESFEAYIEKYKEDKWGFNNRCLYDIVVYWYQVADKKDLRPGDN